MAPKKKAAARRTIQSGSPIPTEHAAQTVTEFADSPEMHTRISTFIPNASMAAAKKMTKTRKTIQSGSPAPADHSAALVDGFAESPEMHSTLSTVIPMMHHPTAMQTHNHRRNASLDAYKMGRGASIDKVDHLVHSPSKRRYLSLDDEDATILLENDSSSRRSSTVSKNDKSRRASLKKSGKKTQKVVIIPELIVRDPESRATRYGTERSISSQVTSYYESDEEDTKPKSLLKFRTLDKDEDMIPNSFALPLAPTKFRQTNDGDDFADFSKYLVIPGERVKKENKSLIFFDVPERQTNFSKQDHETSFQPLPESHTFSSDECPVDALCKGKIIRPFSPALDRFHAAFIEAKSAFSKGSIDRPTLNNIRDRFCQYHNAELDIIPKGIEARYPTVIDFRAIEARIRNLGQEIQKFLDPSFPSLFRKRVKNMFAELGSIKAQSQATLMSRLDQLPFGYYGWPGSELAFKLILVLFPRIKPAESHPQQTTDFVQHVLVPETVAILISQDYGFSIGSGMAEAYKIQQDSSAFGNIMQA